MRERLADVICDTSFLIHLASFRIKNISSLDVEIGPISFAVPRIVASELELLSRNSSKRDGALAALDLIRDKKILAIDGDFADRAILGHVRLHGGIVATMDRELKALVKEAGGSIISFSNDRIVLEP